ncbi:agamous-like MADS-box protein AGL80 [Apium graveolens]|uniref:agamous-like MADS-box protein AGL80 n=1 Tax=Apium graveolens TaxID=4045 RepID=UPI003D7A8377
MARKKVKLGFITNNTTRRVAYNKRKKDLLKKMDELSTLCDVNACAITYSPYDPQPQVWPNATAVQGVVDQFKSMPEIEQGRNMMSLESIIKQRIAKTNEKLNQQMTDNREEEMTEVMYQCLTGRLGLNNLKLSDLNHLGSLIEHKMTEINKRIAEMSTECDTGNQISTSAGDNIGVLATGVVEQQNSVTDLVNDGLVPIPYWFNESVINDNGAANDQNSQGSEETASFRDVYNSLWRSAFFP